MKKSNFPLTWLLDINIIKILTNSILRMMVGGEKPHIVMRFTEGVKLSGKKTSAGRNSGETIMAPKGINLSGKRTEETVGMCADI